MKVKKIYNQLNVIEAKIKSCKIEWRHNFDFGGIKVKGQTSYEMQEWHQSCLPQDYTNKVVLDIGCADGFYSFDAASKNAKKVYMIDDDMRETRGIALELLDYDVEFLMMDLYDLKKESFRDVNCILFMGIFYHLKYPFFALDILKNLLTSSGEIYLETLISNDSKIDLEFIKNLYPKNAQCWFRPSKRFFIELLTSFDFKEIKLLSSFTNRAFYRIGV